MTDSVETALQFEARQVLRTGDLGFRMHDAVAKAFLRTASIKLEFTETNPNLPAPIGSPNYPDWPEISGTSFSVYQDYAKFHHDELKYGWIIFYVNHYAKNDTTRCGAHLIGFNHHYASNVPQPNRDDRFTFIFVTDIQKMDQTLCTPPLTAQQLENQFSHYVAHEFGHQRAGLTDYYWEQSPPGNLQYHGGPVPRNRQDVMSSPLSFAEKWGYADPVFDSWGNEQSGDHSTCRGNLVTNRSVR